ncbi:MAG: hypothetical protein ACI4C3_07855 [Bacteroides sp.]
MWFEDVGLDTRAFPDGAVKVPGEVEDGLSERLVLLFLLAVMTEGEDSDKVSPAQVNVGEEGGRK